MGLLTYRRLEAAAATVRAWQATSQAALWIDAPLVAAALAELERASRAVTAEAAEATPLTGPRSV